MNVIRMHDYLTYAPEDANPNVPALRRILYSFFVALAIAVAACMFVMGRDIGISSRPAPQRAAIHHCACMGNSRR